MTKPEVFIIESLSFGDENENLYEGKIISQIIHLSDKESIYYYIRTKSELEEVLQLFWDSEYRYLHISCHGNRTSMSTTLDTIPFEELSELLKPCLEGRRLFLSACSMTNRNLAKAVIPSSECLSIIGPARTVNFNNAAILWSSFYHLMFRDNSKAMKSFTILQNLKNVAQMYKVPLNYYSKSTRRKLDYQHKRINVSQK